MPLKIWGARSHSAVKLKCRNKYSTIKFGNWILHLKSGQSIVVWRFDYCFFLLLFSWRSCCVFNTHFEVRWFINFTTPRWRVIVWWSYFRLPFFSKFLEFNRSSLKLKSSKSILALKKITKSGVTNICGPRIQIISVKVTESFFNNSSILVTKSKLEVMPNEI